MTKDEAREQAWDAYAGQSIEFTVSGAFDAGYDAAMARECVWTPTRNFPPEYSTSCRQKRVDEDSAMRDYCPYCGGLIKDSGEEKND